MGHKMKLVGNFSRVEPQKMGLAMLIVCFLVSMSLVSMSIPRSIPLPNLSLRLSLHMAETDHRAHERTNSLQIGEDSGQENVAKEIKPKCGGQDSTLNLCNEDDIIRPYEHFPSKTSDASTRKDNDGVPQQLGSQNEVLERDVIFDDPKPGQGRVVGDITSNNSTSTGNTNSTPSEDIGDLQRLGIKDVSKEKNMKCDRLKSGHCELIGDSTIQMNSSTTIIGSTTNDSRSDDMGQKNSTTVVHSAKKEDNHGEDASEKTMKLELKQPLCNFSDPRYDICEMDGDIRIHGNSYNVVFVTPSQMGYTRNESWLIRPYARKGAEKALGHVRQVVVSSSAEGPTCTLNHSIPAIVFSVTGFTGNLFHDFTDVLIPLFTTARQFDGEVQFLVSDFKPWWIYKYRLILKALSRYQVINFNNDDRVHCFKHVIIGLHSHKELSIDPSRSPNGNSMLDFMQFMRNSYSLERHRPIKIGEVPGRKPRLLLIARKRTRIFLNVDEIVRMAEELGYEVVVSEANVSSDVARFAHVVNSCDVMMGVHGAGLTNFVFLPANASLIQIVPWGGLESICMLDFGYPAMDAKLKYLQYQITERESSLIDVYPRDHPVFKDPFAYHNRGWEMLQVTFMDTQNVRVDVRRFRAVLLEALEHLKQ